MKLFDEGLELLGEEECLRLLESAQIGRVAICSGEVAAVFPVTFAMVGGEIVFFTGNGTKLEAAKEGRTVSFEVDEIDPVERGWSVLAVGQATLAGPALMARAVALGLYPWVAGERHNLVKIRPTFLSGRRILHGTE
jgi:uncharacterized protein